MTVTRIDPTIPMLYGRLDADGSWIVGVGRAMFLIDYGEDHHIFWTIADGGTGQIWTIDNTNVRVQGNISMGTTCEWPGRYAGLKPLNDAAKRMRPDASYDPFGGLSDGKKT